jgi:tetratricopeptide (TPR) repeat protein
MPGLLGQPSRGRLPRFAIRLGVSTAFFSPDGRYVVTAGEDKKVYVWEVNTGKKAAGPLEHPEPVSYAAFSPDGKQVVTASGFRARVWDALTGKLITAELQHSGTVYRMAFSRDGRYLATTSGDGTARVWETQHYKPVTPPLRHGLPVFHAEFSPDSRRLLTACTGHAQVWDVASGEPLTAPMRHGGEVTHAVFSPNGRRVATTGRDGLAQLWTLPDGDGRPLEDLNKLDRLLNGQQREGVDQLTPLGGDTLQALCRELCAKYPAEFSQGPGAERTLAWHRRAAEASEAAGEWHAAAFHRGRLIAAEKEPKKAAELFAARGRALAEQQKWDAAAADFRQAVKQNGGPAEMRCRLAVALLRAGDRESYRRACQELLEQHGQDADAAAPWVLGACVLDPGPGLDDRERILKLARQAAARRPRDPAVRTLLAAALFRAGHNEDALRELSEAIFLAHAADRTTLHVRELGWVSLPAWLPQPTAGAWNAALQPLLADALLKDLKVSPVNALWLALVHHRRALEREKAVAKTRRPVLSHQRRAWRRDADEWFKRAEALSHTGADVGGAGAATADWLSRAEREILWKELQAEGLYAP